MYKYVTACILILFVLLTTICFVVLNAITYVCLRERHKQKCQQFFPYVLADWHKNVKMLAITYLQRGLSIYSFCIIYPTSLKLANYT